MSIPKPAPLILESDNAVLTSSSLTKAQQRKAVLIFFTVGDGTFLILKNNAGHHGEKVNAKRLAELRRLATKAAQ